MRKKAEKKIGGKKFKLKILPMDIDLKDLQHVLKQCFSKFHLDSTTRGT
jgi:hypothetical protein